jgi:vacuolar protein sorting-associated protein 53
MAIIVQLREIDFACDPAFGTMSRTLWPNLKQVSGQSPYAGELVLAVEQVIEVVKPLVEQKKYLRNLFDKTCRWVAARKHMSKMLTYL